MIKHRVFDGNKAAAYAAYAFSDAFAVYPITPSTPMAEYCDKWIREGRKNIYGKVPNIYTLQSEKGVGGMLHGLLRGGSLATTFTSSQGLLLMLPVIYRLAGEHLPAVIHVASRSLATNALSIYGDHSDVMAVRSSGAVIISSSSVQEAMIMSAAAHRLALRTSLPVIHFFDGFDTSHELRDINVADYEDLVNDEHVREAERFRETSITKDRLYGPSLGPEIFFEVQEASNDYYKNVDQKLDEILADLNRIFGSNNSSVDYYGCRFPQNVTVSMGSVYGTIKEVIDEKRYGNNAGINIHLFRPFPSEKLNSMLPKSVRNIAVLDRVKDIAANSEPLMSDVVNSLFYNKRNINIIGGHYGLASKDTCPSDIRAVFAEMSKPSPMQRFSVGINDDHDHSSLKKIESSTRSKKNCREILIYACGSQGSVSACKAMSEIIAASGFHLQCKSFYDARKSGNLTVSEIRFSSNEIKTACRIQKADIAVVYSPEFLPKVLSRLEDNAALIVNTDMNEEAFKEYLQSKKLPSAYKFYLIDASRFSELIGSSPFINTIMKTAALVVLSEGNKELRKKFLSEESLSLFCRDYGKADEKLLLSLTAGCLKEFTGHSGQKLKDTAERITVSDVISLQLQNGSCPVGLSEKAPSLLSGNFPLWNAEKCVQCNACVNQCPHSAIRPFILNKTEIQSGMAAIPSKDIEGKFFRIQISPEHCMACGNCSSVCSPGALSTFASKDSEDFIRESEYWKQLKEIINPITKSDMIPNNVREAAFKRPLLEFPGSCRGCAQTAYISLLTRIFGSRLVIANATGCSSIWGGTYPYIPYRADENGKAPTFANSLFENNAEFGAGINEGMKFRNDCQSVSWIIGGDGWAADIDCDGIDHLLNQNADINILILDNGSYANTGGQYSSLSPLGSDCSFKAANSIKAKDIGMQYIIKDNVYVSSVCIGADLKQTFMAFTEAAAHHGPSVVIAYCPCRLHGIKSDISRSYLDEQKKAVKCGFRFLYRYNPTALKRLNLDAAFLDKALLKNYLLGERRFNEKYVSENIDLIFEDRVRALNKLRNYSFLT